MSFGSSRKCRWSGRLMSPRPGLEAIVADEVIAHQPFSLTGKSGRCLRILRRPRDLDD